MAHLVPRSALERLHDKCEAVELRDGHPSAGFRRLEVDAATIDLDGTQRGLMVPAGHTDFLS
jgi:hypothetical protein